MIRLFMGFYMYLQVMAPTKGQTCCSALQDRSLCPSLLKQLGRIDAYGSTADKLDILVHSINLLKPNSIDIFWKCANSSFTVLKEVEASPHRICCDKSKTSACTDACHKVKSRSILHQACKTQQHTKLYSCISEIDKLSRCCSQASSTLCRVLCRYFSYKRLDIHRTHVTIKHYCGHRHFTRCHHQRMNTWDHYPRKALRHSSTSLSCCNQGLTPACKKTCQHALTTLTENKAIDELIQSCGTIVVENPLWKCFLETSRSNRHRKESNHLKKIQRSHTQHGAKLHCCSKAQSEACRNICFKAYGLNWIDSWADFRNFCLSAQGLNADVALSSCLADVEQPCTMGCNGMKYCANFNGRSTEMFRACNLKADSAAERHMIKWSKGIIHLPHLTIHVNDILKCEPEMWKAIACTIEIKPCQSHFTSLEICRSDCEYILRKCISTEQLKSGQTVESLCQVLSHHQTQSSCVSVQQYMYPETELNRNAVITNPCAAKPCRDNQVCMVRRHKCRMKEHCNLYVCRSGCGVGAVSSFFVPRNTHARLPSVSGDTSRGCYQVCRCSHKGYLDRCSVSPCVHESKCLINSDTVIAHGSVFTKHCNKCTCHAGEILCTNENCAWTSQKNSGLPCDCTEKFQPVCAQNGVTYASSCLSKCAGYKDYQRGPCNHDDPCKRTSQPCPYQHSCLSRPTVCLDSASRCKQYHCEKQSLVCNMHRHLPVCSIEGQQFNNPCSLLSANRSHGYFGSCEVNCSTEGAVCGLDHVTYRSECHAFAVGVAVDYKGSCFTTGLYNGSAGTGLCQKVFCSPVHQLSCISFLPPGACCPICGSQLRVGYKKKLANQVSEKQSQSYSLNQVIFVISSLITVVECRAFGYLDVTSDIIVIIKAISSQPSLQEIVACRREAEYLEYLVLSSSPLIQTRLVLSPLIIVTSLHSHIQPVYRKANDAIKLVTPSHCIVCTVWLFISLLLL